MVEDASSRTCRLDALLSLLSSQCALIVAGQRRHPPTLSSSLQLFVNTHNHLMFADGPLAHHHRHYIALLVRSVHLYTLLLAHLLVGRLSLLPSAGWGMSTSRRAMNVCGWGVKAGIAHVTRG